MTTLNTQHAQVSAASVVKKNSQMSVMGNSKSRTPSPLVASDIHTSTLTTSTPLRPLDPSSVSSSIHLHGGKFSSKWSTPILLLTLRRVLTVANTTGSLSSNAEKRTPSLEAKKLASLASTSTHACKIQTTQCLKRCSSLLVTWVLVYTWTLIGVLLKFLKKTAITMPRIQHHTCPSQIEKIYNLLQSHSINQRL